MRLIITFKCLNYNKYSQNELYFLHSFIYDKLRDTNAEHLHDDKQRKYFSYTPVFPYRDNQIGDIKRFVISSPDTNLVSLFHSSFAYLLHQQIELGNARYVITDIKKFDKKLYPNMKLKTSNMIILKSNEDGMYFGYSKRTNRLSEFIQLLENNMNVKYKKFFNIQNKDHDILLKDCFDTIKIKKYASSPLTKSKSNSFVIGSSVDFRLKNNLTPLQMNFLQFNFDAGFGMKTAMGFGSMNVC